ncbi:MAG: hypothetical protein IPO07_26315 [Haliscomenobacter sp.]|nr:hypothetical protein [Haliscomenobacter sp.]MBK9491923.1 hypothetical protein [Haliscomenobacter sp.]
MAEYTEMSYTYGSGMRDRAMILETLVLLKDMKKAGALVQYLSQGLSSQRWYSTQTVAYTLMAVSKYLGDQKATQTFGFSYAVSGGQSTSANSKSAIMQINLPAGGSNTSLTVKNTSKASSLCGWCNVVNPPLDRNQPRPTTSKLRLPTPT